MSTLSKPRTAQRSETATEGARTVPGRSASAPLDALDNTNGTRDSWPLRAGAARAPGSPGDLRGWRLWRDWIAANAVGELAGLAIPAVAGLVLAQQVGLASGKPVELAGAAAIVLAGTLEGVAVGLAQWSVLRRVFPSLNAGRWVRWTALGAAVAWILGMLPSVLLDDGDGQAAPGFAQMSEPLKYTLAAAMGLVLGPVLGIPQWLVLRRHARGAFWWVPANSAAWALGMPIIFAAASSVAPGTSLPSLALVAGAAFMLAGAVVGAVHGLALVHLASLHSEQRAGRPHHSDASLNEFKQRPLQVHRFLNRVPLRTLERVELPGGREGMTLPEISRAAGFTGEVQMEVGPVTQALFSLRTRIGRVLRWDQADDLVKANSYISRLTADDRARSLITPGQPAGISRILYQFENEMLGEIINRTVHCFWLMAKERTPTGYALWFAVYVRKLNWFTPIYMALITPLLQWIIYPAMVRGIRQHWEEAFPVETSAQGVLVDSWSKAARERDANPRNNTTARS